MPLKTNLCFNGLVIEMLTTNRGVGTGGAKGAIAYLKGIRIRAQYNSRGI